MTMQFLSLEFAIYVYQLTLSKYNNEIMHFKLQSEGEANLRQILTFKIPAKRIQHFIQNAERKCWMECWMRLTTYVGPSNICKLMLDEV